MKRLLFVGIICLLSLNSKAQRKPINNFIGVNFEFTNRHTSKTQMQRSILRYSIRYNKKLKNNRYCLEGNIGYMSNYINENWLSKDFKGTQSNRIYFDININYNLLRSRRHTVRIGVGPTLWNQRNSLLDNISYIDNKIIVTRKKEVELIPGFNFQATYEYSITPKIVLGAKLGVVGSLISPDPRGAIPNNFLTKGVSIGYLF